MTACLPPCFSHFTGHGRGSYTTTEVCNGPSTIQQYEGMFNGKAVHVLRYVLLPRTGVSLLTKRGGLGCAAKLDESVRMSVGGESNTHTHTHTHDVWLRVTRGAAERLVFRDVGPAE